MHRLSGSLSRITTFNYLIFDKFSLFSCTFNILNSHQFVRESRLHTLNSPIFSKRTCFLFLRMFISSLTVADFNRPQGLALSFPSHRKRQHKKISCPMFINTVPHTATRLLYYYLYFSLYIFYFSFFSIWANLKLM